MIDQEPEGDREKKEKNEKKKKQTNIVTKVT